MGTYLTSLPDFFFVGASWHSLLWFTTCGDIFCIRKEVKPIKLIWWLDYPILTSQVLAI